MAAPLTNTPSNFPATKRASKKPFLSMNQPVNRFHCLMLLVALVAASFVHAQPSDLLAHGTDDVFWVAQVVSSTDGKQRHEETIIRARGIGGGQTRWVEVTRLNERVIDL